LPGPNSQWKIFAGENLKRMLRGVVLGFAQKNEALFARFADEGHRLIGEESKQLIVVDELKVAGSQTRRR